MSDETIRTLGYPSAARFVASVFAGANLDNRTLPGVCAGVVMGRHVGVPDRRPLTVIIMSIL